MRASVAHTGACECLTDLDCASGLWCRHPPGACSATGECRGPLGEACLPYWEPVCGCDGRTYSNEECAAAEGVSVAHDGEC